MFNYALSFGQENYRISTSEQPMGICYLIEVEKDKSAKEVFEKVKSERELLMKKLFELDSEQQKNVKKMMIILFDVGQ
jgi:hypothetical protein